jgi:hypothetical protein
VNKRLQTLGALVVLIAASSVGGSVPSALSQGGNGETFKLKSIDNKEEVITVDANDSGEDDSGDYEVGAGPVFQGGKKVGNQRHECFFMPFGKDSFISRCGATFKVQGRGTIEVHGTLRFDRGGGVGSSFSITGGTGEFSGASGSMKFDGTRNSTIFTFKVR